MRSMECPLGIDQKYIVSIYFCEKMIYVENQPTAPAERAGTRRQCFTDNTHTRGFFHCERIVFGKKMRCVEASLEHAPL